MSFAVEVRSARGKRLWQTAGSYEFLKEAQACVRAKGETILEARISQIPEKPTRFWDFTQECSFQRTPGFRHSPDSEARK